MDENYKTDIRQYIIDLKTLESTLKSIANDKDDIDTINAIGFKMLITACVFLRNNLEVLVD